MAPNTSTEDSFESVLSKLKGTKAAEIQDEITQEEIAMRSILQAYFLVDKDVYFIALLKRYKQQLNFQQEKKPILNIIGLFDGEILKAVLPNLPIKFAKIIAIDKNKDIVSNVAKHIKETGQTITFLTADVEKKITKMEPCDYIFSLWRMHLVKKQGLMIKHMYGLLNPGGCLLMSFVTKSVVYEVFKKMANSAKWENVKNDLERVISPYQDSKHPFEELHEYLKTAGFTDIDIELVNRTYAFNNIESFFEKIRLILDGGIGLPDLINGMFYRDVLKEFEYKGYVIRTKHPETVLIKIPVELVNIFAMKPQDLKANSPEAMALD